MTDITQMIATYGVLPVLAAAVIFAVIYTMRAQHKFNEKQQEVNNKQQEQNTQQEQKVMDMLLQLGTTLAQVNKNTNTQHSKEEEEENRKVDEYVNKQLRRLLEDNQANRASCFLYHNGGRNVVGRSFQKMSMTHEQIDTNTVSMMQSYQQVPRMMYPIINEKMAEQGWYYINDIKEIQETDAITYQSYYSRGVKAVFIQAIKATSGAIMGFITLEYISNDVPQDQKQLRHCLINKSMKISGALEIKDIQASKG